MGLQSAKPSWIVSLKTIRISIMKKVLISATALLAASFASADTVKMGTEGAYAPWNFINDAGELAGFEIELGNELCARAGIECEWVVNEWDSIIPNLVAGNYDTIIAGMSITAERDELIDFTQDYYPPDPSKWAATADMGADVDPSGATVGVQASTIQAAWVAENLGDAVTIKEYSTADESMADLSAGVVDLVLADGGYLAPFVDGESIFFVGPDVMIGGGVSMGIRETDAELKASMNAAIDSVKADGTLDSLIMKYFETGPFYAN